MRAVTVRWFDRRAADQPIGRHPRAVPRFERSPTGGALKAVDLARGRHRLGAMVDRATSALSLLFAHDESLRRDSSPDNATLVAGRILSQELRVHLGEYLFKQRGAVVMSHAGTSGAPAGYPGHVYWSLMMKKLAIAFAVGAAALMGGSAANAADNAVKAKGATDATRSSTEFSSQYRHWRHHH